MWRGGACHTLRRVYLIIYSCVFQDGGLKWEGGGGLSRRDLVVCGGNEARAFLMQRAMAGGEQGQGGGGQHGFGHDGRGADDGCHGLGDHVGGGQRRSVAQYQGSGDRPNCMVGDNTGQTAGSCGGDGQDGGENSLRGKTPLTRALLPDLTLLLLVQNQFS